MSLLREPVNAGSQYPVFPVSSSRRDFFVFDHHVYLTSSDDAVKNTDLVETFFQTPPTYFSVGVPSFASRGYC